MPRISDAIKSVNNKIIDKVTESVENAQKIMTSYEAPRIEEITFNTPDENKEDRINEFNELKEKADQLMGRTAEAVTNSVNESVKNSVVGSNNEDIFENPPNQSNTNSVIDFLVGGGIINGIGRINNNNVHETNTNSNENIINSTINEADIDSVYFDIVRSVNDKTLNKTLKGDVKKLFDGLVSNDFIEAENIDDITFTGANGQNIKVTLNDGYEYFFTNESGRISLSSVQTNDDIIYFYGKSLNDMWDDSYGKIEQIYFGPDGDFVIKNDDNNYYMYDSSTNKIDTYLNYDKDTRIMYDYNIDANEKNRIRSIYGLDENADIDCIARSSIRGNEIDYYSVEVEGENTAIMPINFTELYSEHYSDETLSLIDKYFQGVFISPWEYSSHPSMEGKAGAYVSEHDGNPFMYVPSSSDFKSEYYTINTPLHEMGHAIQSIEEKLNVFDLQELTNCYEEYKNLLPQFDYSCYNYKRGIYEIPNEHEFFADISVNYFMDPTLLERYMPEAYNLAKKIYG